MYLHQCRPTWVHYRPTYFKINHVKVKIGYMLKLLRSSVAATDRKEKINSSSQEKKNRFKRKMEDKGGRDILNTNQWRIQGGGADVRPPPFRPPAARE